MRWDVRLKASFLGSEDEVKNSEMEDGFLSDGTRNLEYDTNMIRESFKICVVRDSTG
jgi:hypothetical protein